MAIPMKQAIQNALGLNTSTSSNQYNQAIQQASTALGKQAAQSLGGYGYGIYPTISPQHLPDPQEVKKNFEEYLKRYLALYSGMYTNLYEKELVENLKGLLVLDKVKSL